MVLRKISETDRGHIESLFKCPDVRKYLGGPLNSGDAFKKADDLIINTPEYFWVIKDSKNIFTGIIELSQHHDSDHLEISYQLKKEGWGKGLICN